MRSPERAHPGRTRATDVCARAMRWRRLGRGERRTFFSKSTSRFLCSVSDADILLEQLEARVKDELRSFVERSDYTEIGFNFPFLLLRRLRTNNHCLSRALTPVVAVPRPCYTWGFAEYRRYPLYKKLTSAELQEDRAGA